MADRPATPRRPASYGVVLAEPQQIAVRRSVLSIGRGVYQRVDDTGRPRQYGGYDVQPGVADAVVRHVHDHQREETGEEAQEYCQHQRRQARVLFLLSGRLSAQFAATENKNGV